MAAATAAPRPNTILVKFQSGGIRINKMFRAARANQEQMPLPEHIKEVFRKLLSVNDEFKAPLPFANKHLELSYTYDGSEINVSATEDILLAVEMNTKVFKLGMAVRSRSWGVNVEIQVQLLLLVVFSYKDTELKPL